MNAAALDELLAFARAGRFFRTARTQLSHWQAPAAVDCGEAVVLRWRAVGASAVHIQLGGVHPLNQRAGASGEYQFVPESAGQVTVTMRLLSDDERAQWVEHEVAPIEVRQVVLGVRVSHTRLHGAPDEQVWVRWAAHGAQMLSVRRENTGELFELPAQGNMKVRMGYAQDGLVFTATSLDGRVAQAACSLVPNAMGNTRLNQAGLFQFSTIHQPMELSL